MIIQDKISIQLTAKLKYRHHNGVWSDYITGILTNWCYQSILDGQLKTQSTTSDTNYIIGKRDTNSEGILTNIAFGTSDYELTEESTFSDIVDFNQSDSSYMIEDNFSVKTKCTRNTITYLVGHAITTNIWCNRIFYFNKFNNNQNISIVFNLQNKIQPNDYEVMVEFEFIFDDTAKQGFDSIGRGFNRKVINRYITQNSVDYSNLIPGICYNGNDTNYSTISLNSPMVRSGSGLLVPYVQNTFCSTPSSVSISINDIPYNATLTNDLDNFPTQETDEQLNFARVTPQTISINDTNRIVNYKVSITDNKGCMLVFRGVYYLFDNGYMADAYTDEVVLELSVGFNEIAEEINPEDVADKSKRLQYHRLVVDKSSDSFEYKHCRYGIATQTGINADEPDIDWQQETTIIIKTPNQIIDIGSIPPQCTRLNLYVAGFDNDRTIKQRDYEKVDETIIAFNGSDEQIDFKMKVFYVDNGFEDLTQYEPIAIVGELQQYFALHYLLRIRNGVGILNPVIFNGVEKKTLLNCNINIVYDIRFIDSIEPNNFVVKEGTNIESAITTNSAFDPTKTHLITNFGVIRNNELFAISASKDMTVFIRDVTSFNLINPDMRTWTKLFPDDTEIEYTPDIDRNIVTVQSHDGNWEHIYCSFTLRDESSINGHIRFKFPEDTQHQSPLGFGLIITTDEPTNSDLTENIVKELTAISPGEHDLRFSSAVLPAGTYYVDINFGDLPEGDYSIEISSLYMMTISQYAYLSYFERYNTSALTDNPVFGGTKQYYVLSGTYGRGNFNSVQSPYKEFGNVWWLNTQVSAGNIAIQLADLTANRVGSVYTLEFVTKMVSYTGGSWFNAGLTGIFGITYNTWSSGRGIGIYTNSAVIQNYGYVNGWDSQKVKSDYPHADCAGKTLHHAFVIDTVHETVRYYFEGEIGYEVKYVPNSSFFLSRSDYGAIPVLLSQLVVRDGDLSINDGANFEVPEIPYY